MSSLVTYWKIWQRHLQRPLLIKTWTHQENIKNVYSETQI